MTESVELTVSDKTSADVSGNVSIVDGFVDFYVTSPSGIVLLCYNKTAFDKFSFTAVENGTYVIHLANRFSTNNITATLNYGVNFEITLHVKIPLTWHTISVWQVTLTSSPPVDFLEILRILVIAISTIYSLATLGEKASKLLRWFYWKIKHGKSKTPVVLSLLIDTMARACRGHTH
ncbi:MAG: emp24/gp25L/p24 family protein [Candidatus Bathyarchaeota archaeon]|nr:emp24/gp25L/p24 family protein [Candidatus Bathyarchaeota archaeon]MDH5595379.1 emp24/gp25L/p24 family protein [Candidatus Bathyarchaeota archaeon]